MPNTLIQIKRASTVTIPMLEAGEPAIDFDSGSLYIGDGVTNPGLQFLSTSATLAAHAIDGASHTIVSSNIGATIRVSSINNIETSRLGYYDLGSSTDVNYSAGVDVADSRKHWINTEHVSTLSKAIFYTNAGTTVDMSHYPNTGDETSGYSLNEGYSLKELSYANAGSVPKVLVADIASGGTLSFRQLTVDDISGIDTSNTDITGLSGPYKSIFYTRGTSGDQPVESLTYIYTDATGTPNRYLKTNKQSGSTLSTLSFGAVDYADLVGTFNFGSATALDNWTLRYTKNKTDGTGWTPNGILKVYTRQSGDENRCGVVIDNFSVPTKVGRFAFNDYTGTTLASSLELVTIDAVNRSNIVGDVPGGGTFLEGRFGPVLNIAAGRKHFAIAVTSNYTTQLPNMWFDEQGNIKVWSPTSLTSNYGIVNVNASADYYGLRFENKSITYVSTSTKVLPSYSVISSGDITVTYNKTNITDSTRLVSGINFGNITINTGTASPTMMQSGRFMSFGIISTKSHAYGLYIEGVSTTGTTSGKVTEGIYIGSIGNSIESGTTGDACGMRIHQIQSDGNAYGFAIDHISADKAISGLTIVGSTLSTTTTDSDINRGIHLKTFASSASTIAIDISGIGGKNSCGISLINIASTDSGSSKRRVALYINNSDTSSFYNKITQIDTTNGVTTLNSNYGIVALASKHYIGGNITISGTTNVNNLYVNNTFTLGPNGTANLPYQPIGVYFLKYSSLITTSILIPDHEALNAQDAVDIALLKSKLKHIGTLIIYEDETFTSNASLNLTLPDMVGNIGQKLTIINRNSGGTLLIDYSTLSGETGVAIAKADYGTYHIVNGGYATFVYLPKVKSKINAINNHIVNNVWSTLNDIFGTNVEVSSQMTYGWTLLETGVAYN